MLRIDAAAYRDVAMGSGCRGDGRLSRADRRYGVKSGVWVSAGGFGTFDIQTARLRVTYTVGPTTRRGVSNE